MKIKNFEKKPRDIHQINPYAKIRFSVSKNEAAMQKTAITKKMEKIRVNNSAKK